MNQKFQIVLRNIWNSVRIGVSLNQSVGMMKGYLKAFAYVLCHCEARIGVSLNQSVGMMKGYLKAFARKLTDYFSTLAMTKPLVTWNDERVFEIRCTQALSLRGTNLP